MQKNTPTLLSRYRGAMLGTLVGDALGAPYEWTWTPEMIAEDFAKRGGLVAHEYEPFDYIDPWKKTRKMKAGQPTDDSELAAALALSLVMHPEFSAKDLYLRLRDFIVERKSLLTEVAYGTGSTLRAALKPQGYEDSVLEFSAGGIPTPPSNGSLMRCIGVPLRFGYGGLPDGLVETARGQSLVTHRNPLCVAACVAYSVAVAQMLQRFPPAMAWATTRGLLRSRAAQDAALAEVLAIEPTKPDYVRDMGGGYNADGSANTEKQRFGSVVLSLRVALWASVEAESFADGIIKAISVGGDTDTYGAIAGGMLGARFGLEGIPQGWQDVMQGKDVMLTLAEELHKIAKAKQSVIVS